MNDAFDAKVVHVGGIGLLKSFDGVSTVQFLKKAKSFGRIATFDLIQTTSETFDLVEPCLPYIDYFISSLEEAGEMGGVIVNRGLLQAHYNSSKIASFCMDVNLLVDGGFLLLVIKI